VVFLVFSILLLVFMNWLFYHIKTDIAVNAATTKFLFLDNIKIIISFLDLQYLHYFLSGSFQIKMGPQQNNYLYLLN
jgi:hypothetical protein